MPRIVSRLLQLLAPAAWLAFAHASTTLAAGDLAPPEVAQLSRFERYSGLRDVPEAAREQEQPRVRARYQEARAHFAGRGPDIAQRFLTHTERPPDSQAYYFLLEAVGDTETTLALIRSLWAPPKVVSGPAISGGGRTWLLERDKSEISVAIESVLVNEAPRRDPRVVAALLEAIANLRPKDPRHGPGDAAMVVTLLGRCTGPDATTALQSLAEDPDAIVRGLAVQGLGESAGAAGPASTLATVARMLRADPDPRARVEAATALGKMGSAEGITPLREALATERNAQVMDAIVLALVQLKSPPSEPKTCGEVVARTWEVHAARFPFTCWRAGVPPEELTEAAINGPLQLRALALYALIEKVAEHGKSQRQLVFSPRAVAPPPPAAPPGAEPITIIPIQPPTAGPGPRAEFDESTRGRLLASAVEVLSRPSAAFPGKGGEISFSTVTVVLDALWEIADRDMSVALKSADRISTPRARFVSQGRYAASYTLHGKNPAAYVEYRRPRQASAGALLAAVLGLLLVWRRTRRAGASLVVAALAWSLWSLSATPMRELPPPPLQFLTLSAIAFLSAGASVAAVALMTQRTEPGGLASAVGRGSAALGIAAVTAFFACGYTRWYDIFPIGGEGWELIFDPIGAAIIAAMAAVVLATLDRVVFRRIFT